MGGADAHGTSNVQSDLGIGFAWLFPQLFFSLAPTGCLLVAAVVVDSSYGAGLGR